jgi:hypothetical protein
MPVTFSRPGHQPIANLTGVKLMSKYNQDFFFQVSRELFKDKDSPALINLVSTSAFKLLIWLHELEHRFTTGPKGGGNKRGKLKQDWFYRSDTELAAETAMSRRTVTACKAELKEAGLIKTWQMHWTDSEGRKSVKHVTAYRLPNYRE